MKSFFSPTQVQKKTKSGRGLIKDNQGSSIVTVLVAMSLVLILVTITLSTTTMNFLMKVNANESKNNFYDAEAALEEVRMGLASTASKVFSEQYMDVMQNYNNYESDKKDQIFSSGYSIGISKLVRVGGDSTKWDKAKIEALLRDTKPVYDASGKLLRGATITTPDGSDGGAALNFLNITNDGVVLKNVRVRYIDEDSYVSEIQTDLLLAVPSVNFAAAATIPDLVNYTIVANEQFVQSGILHMKGSAYLGKDKSKVSGTLTMGTPDAIKDTGSASNIIFGNNSEFASLSQVTLSDVNFYGGNVTVSGLTFTGTGSEYVISNDLNISGKSGGSTAVTLSGKYYGTGTGITAPESSSILINKTKASLDLSGLTNMLIGGVAYVDIKNASEGKEDIMMGESISIKPDQRAYLVPANCVATGYRKGGVNPMTNAQYEQLILEIAGISYTNTNYHEVYTNTSIDVKNLAKSQLVDYTEKTLIDRTKTLADLGVSGFREATYSVTGMKYLFMVFDSTDKAEAYFEKYYNDNAANKSRLEKNLDTYTNSKLILPNIVKQMSDGDTLDFYFAGSVITSAKVDEKNFIKTGTLSPSVTELDAVNLMLVNKSNENKGLNVKLTKDYYSLSSEELAKDVYSNLVIDDMNANGLSAGSGQYFVSETGEACYVKNGDISSVSDVASASTVRNIKDKSDNKHDDANLNVIIANGDVNLDCDFEGLILCSGKVTYDCGSTSHTANANATKVINALSAENSTGLRGCDFLKNSDLYVVGGSGGADDEDSDSFGIDKLVVYANWTKL